MKEAVVYIIDASSSMNRFYTSKETRLDCAKQAVIDSVSDLMLQSKTNEVCVIVCKTKATAHHKIDPGTDLAEEEPPFPHLTELSDGIQCPTAQLLRDIATIQTDDNTDDIQQGDVIQSILLAADALYTRTHKLKFQRKIVVFTDASHNFIVQKEPFLVVVDALRDMECQIIVVGMGFHEDSAALYEVPLPVPSAVTSNGDKRIKREDVDGTSYSVKVKDEPDNSDDEVLYYTEKRNREQLLVTLTEKTGGQVIAASTLQQILDINRGKRLTASKASYPRTKKELILVDEETGQIIRDDEGQVVTDTIKTIKKFAEDEKSDDILPDRECTTAIRYGSDLIPIGDNDYEGLKDFTEKGPLLQILGYASTNQVPRIYMYGPPYVITGAESQKACAAIMGLAQALQRSEKVALCTLKKTSKGSPQVGALIPLTEVDFEAPLRLAFLHLPFAGEVRELSMEAFTNIINETDDRKSKVCDDLIDSLMLPDGCLDSGMVFSPFHRSWNQTMVKRVFDPSVQPETIRQQVDPLKTPPDILAAAEPVLQSFTATFLLKPAPTNNPKKTKGQTGRTILTFKDYL
ncbi:ATP-dependent DNA helicase 2 subunit 2 [Fistulifera solaris]|uniref:ATP-dependent DNA helicase 2 subunit 2 n=1 Tax=Fistulifera solaris TaxID=1519565 RepID=A0A1Z5K0P5_FISSO|nr:ATP-dependent DNA helicase 2 subunit 2 [Fistulifera solaris]|eukprot:GAX19855.1 ATP-dependent DNA helicase 2 subunit 2 [Fistulifera solaris]